VLDPTLTGCAALKHPEYLAPLADVAPSPAAPHPSLREALFATTPAPHLSSLTSVRPLALHARASEDFGQAAPKAMRVQVSNPHVVPEEIASLLEARNDTLDRELLVQQSIYCTTWDFVLISGTSLV